MPIKHNLFRAPELGRRLQCAHQQIHMYARLVSSYGWPIRGFELPIPTDLDPRISDANGRNKPTVPGIFTTTDWGGIGQSDG